MRPTRIAAVAMVLLLAAPAAADRGQGSFTVDGWLELGRGASSADSEAIRLDPGSGETAPIEFHANRANVSYVRYSRELWLDGRVELPSTSTRGPERRTESYGPGNIRLENFSKGAIILVHELIPGNGSTLSWADAQLLPANDHLVVGDVLHGNPDGEIAVSDISFSKRVGRTFATAATGSELIVMGTFELYIWGVDVVIGTDSYPTGIRSDSPSELRTYSNRSDVRLKVYDGNLTVSWNGLITMFRGGAVEAAQLHGTARGTFRTASELITVNGEWDATGSFTLWPQIRNSWSKSEVPLAAGGNTRFFDVRVEGDMETMSGTRTTIADRSVIDGNEAVIAGTLLATLGAAAYYWPLIRFQSMVIFLRLTGARILDNSGRKHLVEIIGSNPGLSSRELQRRAGMTWGTVVHHLRKLEVHGHVSSRRIGRLRVYLPRTNPARGNEEGLVMLQRPKCARLATIIAAEPGITQQELTERARFAQSTVSYYVGRLCGVGLVSEERTGKTVRYEPTPDGIALLAVVAKGNAAPAQAPDLPR